MLCKQNHASGTPAASGQDWMTQVSQNKPHQAESSPKKVWKSTGREEQNAEGAQGAQDALLKRGYVVAMPWTHRDCNRWSCQADAMLVEPLFRRWRKPAIPSCIQGHQAHLAVLASTTAFADTLLLSCARPLERAIESILEEAACLLDTKSFLATTELQM